MKKYYINCLIASEIELLNSLGRQDVIECQKQTAEVCFCYGKLRSIKSKARFVVKSIINNMHPENVLLQGIL